ncbi:MAG: ATP-binding protein [Actinomycetia bacterium]|nr:ATP-binding protein [Actinomycetes bacterium]
MTAPTGVPVCWSHEKAIATISTEAVTPSPAVFFATHVPLRIRRRHPDLSDSDGADKVTENDVHNDFLTRSSPVGVLLMPVIGESGTGKSHLVRWIAERTKSDERRTVVYVPKARTSLRALIRILLERDDVDSPELTRLREKVDEFAATVDEEVLQRQLIGALADVVAQAEPSDSDRRALVGPDKLALMLRDVNVQSHLMRAGSLIPRLATSLLSDRADGEDDRPTEFQVSDLPEITVIEDSARQVRNILRVMSGRPSLQTAAAELLTEALSPAVQAVFGMGQGQLQEAMLNIRKEYLRQGKEIVLLIEDFAVIQGVQRDLLDALIEPAFREGKQELAPVRTLMAVTTGYYKRLAETVRTRVEAATPYVYDLDVSFDTSEQGRADTIEFVGRYLNAARLGTAELIESRVAEGEPVPNKCVQCKFRRPCHAAFGASEHGFGIFPLNWSALRRAIHARPAPGNNPEAFNARTVIGQVVIPVLEEADRIADGEFPDQQFKKSFPLVDVERALRPEVEVAINERDTKDFERRTVLLEYWGDAPDHLVNLDPTIHATFQLPELDLDGEPYIPRDDDGNQKGGTKDGQGRGGTGSMVPASLTQAFGEVDDWAAGRNPLSQNISGKIRRIVAQAVLNRVQWNYPLSSEPDVGLKRRAWPVNSTRVSIESADAEGLPGTKDAPIKFTRSAENSVFFKGLLSADAGVAGANAANKSMRRLAQIAEKYAPTAQAEVVRTRNSDDDTLVAWFTASLLGAVLCGRAWPGMTDDELVAAVFDDGINWHLRDLSFRSESWLKYYGGHREARPGMANELRRLVGVQRGTSGDPRMIDAARVVPLVREAAKAWRWQPPSPMPAKLQDAVAPSGLAQISRLVQAQVGDLRGVNDTLARLLPEGTTLSETLDAVDSAFEHAQGAGLGPLTITDPADFHKLLSDARGADSRWVNRLRKDLEAIDAADDEQARALAELTCAAVDRGPDLPAIFDFLKMCDEWFTSRSVEPSLGASAGDAAAAKVQSMIKHWRKVVGAQ